MSTKHTPGPWIVHKLRGISGHPGKSQWGLYGEGGLIALIENAAKTNVEINASARLIAAAPELLEALQKISSDVEQLIDAGSVHDQDARLLRKTLASVRSTIAKAEGK